MRTSHFLDPECITETPQTRGVCWEDNGKYSDDEGEEIPTLTVQSHSILCTSEPREIGVAARQGVEA